MKKYNNLNTEVTMLQKLFNSDSIFDNGMFYPYFKNQKAFSVPPVNISETETDFVINMAAPGYEKKDFKVNILRDELSIEVSREETNEQKSTSDVYRREFFSGNFRRSFTLPKGVDASAISETYVNGILTITVPKVAPQELQTSVEIK